MASVVVIGGGPSGMMAAISAANKHNVTLLEKNEKLGKKLYITGKGRCNVTNAKDISEFFDFVPGNPHFLYSALYTYTNTDVINFFNERGVKLKIERGDRLFPESDKSSDIIGALQSELIQRKVKILFNSAVKDVEMDNNKMIAVKLHDNTMVKGDYFIFATGGISYPHTGSTGEGLEFAKKLGHSIVEPKPALVPVEIEEEYVKELQGLSLKNIEFNIKDKNNKVLFKEFGEMLFTHFGISGPVVLRGSRVINNKRDLTVSINLKPALSAEELDKRVQNDFIKYTNKNFRNSLDDLLPQKLIEIIIKLSGIEDDKKVNLITREERKKLVSVIQNLTFHIKGLRPVREAIVTAGGVDVKEIDPSTMKSKIVGNVSFIGEMIDVDAYTGGFNVQIALSTGYLAGSMIDEQ